MDFLNSLLPFLFKSFILLTFITFMNWFLIGRHNHGNECKCLHQLIMPDMIGPLTSGLFAFSSTTVTASLLTGMLLRVMRPFRTGDFIRLGELFGRMARTGFLIQNFGLNHIIKPLLAEQLTRPNLALTPPTTTKTFHSYMMSAIPFSLYTHLNR